MKKLRYHYAVHSVCLPANKYRREVTILYRPLLCMLRKDGIIPAGTKKDITIIMDEAPYIGFIAYMEGHTEYNGYYTVEYATKIEIPIQN